MFTCWSIYILTKVDDFHSQQACDACDRLWWVCDYQIGLSDDWVYIYYRVALSSTSMIFPGKVQCPLYFLLAQAIQALWVCIHEPVWLSCKADIDSHEVGPGKVIETYCCIVCKGTASFLLLQEGVQCMPRLVMFWSLFFLRWGIFTEMPNWEGFNAWPHLLIYIFPSHFTDILSPQSCRNRECPAFCALRFDKNDV